MLEMPPQVSPVGCGADKDFVERTAVLPCGHFFGFDCLALWCQQREEEDDYPSCPLCRFPIVYWSCGHPIPIRPYDVSMDRQLQLPPTEPEGGEYSVPPFCESCDRSYIEERAEHIALAIYPHQPLQSFRDPERWGPAVFNVKRHAFIEFILGVDQQARSQLLMW
ncbi:hypothetical protein F4779DRAFT_584831 [Xylariaceae sp. FL0662B]|nr:hypothetical protein F4779DRAFT_584831 [Xylariaceae sp. FL0662B]